jgi:hypothetical protein
MLADFSSVNSLLDWAQARNQDGISKIRPVDIIKDGKIRFAIPGDSDFPEDADSE